MRIHDYLKSNERPEDLCREIDGLKSKNEELHKLIKKQEDEVQENYESYERRLKPLLNQIEKMKNCENCKYKIPDGCDYCGSLENCEDYKYWRLAE